LTRILKSRGPRPITRVLPRTGASSRPWTASPHRPPFAMSLFDTTQTALERALSGASLRQETLAGNLANVNTPGYQRRDVDFHDALRGALAAGDPAAAQFAVRTDAS